MKRWQITNAKTGEVLGVVEKIYRNVGDIYRPCWRVWYQLVDNPTVNGDTRSVVAAYVGGDQKTKMIAI